MSYSEKELELKKRFYKFYYKTTDEYISHAKIMRGN